MGRQVRRNTRPASQSAKSVWMERRMRQLLWNWRLLLGREV